MRNAFLPKEYQKTVRREKILRLTVSFLSLALFAAFLGIVFMAPSYFILVLSKDDLLRRVRAQEEVLAKKELKKLEEEIGGVNKKASAFSEGESKRKKIAPIIAALSSSAPDGVRLSAIILAAKSDPKKSVSEAILTLRGDAEKREDLISYIEKLKTLEEFSSVHSPVTNLLRATDVSFVLELAFKPEFYSYDAKK